ncbi:Aspartic proteinase 39 [Durusdinium trenchii]|uniref:Aspartic proteinase 39 n=1 Tax=Durusdinium trenchii TaxID=1381693 RepID=A0ABP0KGA1_9DINO
MALKDWFIRLSLLGHWITSLGIPPPPDQVQRTVLFGNINAFAYYFAELLVGSPQQPVSVIVDTGSALCGFPCEDCGHCGQHLNPPFDMKKSTTSKVLPCGIGCDRCIDGKCGYLESYTEGSSISGLWFRDLVMLNGSDQDNQPVFASLGCHTDERKLFYTQKVNGILGLAPHRITGKSNVLKDLYQDKAHVNHEIFAFCLAEWGGLLTVGGYDPSFVVPGHRLQWLPMHAAGYFGVTLQKLSCGLQVVGTQLDFGTTVLDSGTTFTYLPEQVYNALLTALKTQCANIQCNARAVQDNCWEIVSGADPTRFPNVTLELANGPNGVVAIQWLAHAYMFRRKANIWCYAFANNGMSKETVLGISFFLHQTVVFDTSQSKLGIAESKCPESHYQTRSGRPAQAVREGAVQDGNFKPSDVLEGDDLVPAKPPQRMRWVALALGIVGLVLLVVACSMCLWAYFMDDSDEELGLKSPFTDNEQ